MADNKKDFLTSLAENGNFLVTNYLGITVIAAPVIFVGMLAFSSVAVGPAIGLACFKALQTGIVGAGILTAARAVGLLRAHPREYLAITVVAKTARTTKGAAKYAWEKLKLAKAFNKVCKPKNNEAPTLSSAPVMMPRLEEPKEKYLGKGPK